MDTWETPHIYLGPIWGMQHFMCVFDQIALNTTSESFKLYVVIVWLSEKGVHSEAKKQVDF